MEEERVLHRNPLAPPPWLKLPVLEDVLQVCEAQPDVLEIAVCRIVEYPRV